MVVAMTTLRPHVEAMAMGLPLIATNWSGPTAFMTPVVQNDDGWPGVGRFCFFNVRSLLFSYVYRQARAHTHTHTHTHIHTHIFRI